MTLSAGTRLGPYEILAPIGAGGMGEVYKARDTRLDRIVAIKVAGEQFSERFEREARAVAALNHPHICTLYDVGPNYLVMEYIEGQALKGPLPLDETLRLAGQICDSLDAAHRKGITHRDLKPANILVNKAGVKLLDFGLAKRQSTTTALDDRTVTKALTTEGTILGTLHYMAPEQLQGKDADPRSDIFAFGLVLYEMLTGRRAFDGDNAASLIGAILHTEPPSVTSLAPVTPPSLERIVTTCLAKDPDNRWQTARDLKRELDWVGQPSAPAAAPAKSRRPIRWMAATAIVAAIGAVAYIRKPVPPQPVLRMSILPPDDASFYRDGRSFGSAISPDGRMLAFVAKPNEKGQPLLYVRPLDSLAARALPGTEGAGTPFWSPDSRSIGYFGNRKLYRTDIAGGAPQAICDGGGSRGATWNSDGVILFCMGANYADATLYRVPATGGTPLAVTALNTAEHEDAHYWPQFLPDGKHFLYMGRSRTQGKSAIFVESLDDKPGQRRRIRVTDSAFKAVYAPPRASSRGHLLFVRGSVVMAQPFDEASLALSGDPVSLDAGVGVIPSNGYADFSTSPAGFIAFGSVGSEARTLGLRDRAGKLLHSVGQAGFGPAEISPDGKRVASARLGAPTGLMDIWLTDLERENSMRFTFDGDNRNPVWSPDGRQIAFSVLGKGIFVKAASGAGNPRQLTSGTVHTPMSWSRDGRFLLYTEFSAHLELWVLPVSEEGAATPAKPYPYLKTRFNEISGQFSPDGKWVAYQSDESGSPQVYVRGFPEPLGKWQISTNGGQYPRWRGDGKELFYSAAGKLMVASVNTAAETFIPGRPVELFPVGSSLFGWGDTRDGQRFLTVETSKEQGVQSMTVLFNWQDGLKK